MDATAWLWEAAKVMLGANDDLGCDGITAAASLTGPCTTPCDGEATVDSTEIDGLLFVRPARAAALFGMSGQQLVELARSGVIRRYRPRATRIVLYSVAELRSIIEAVPAPTD